MTVLVTGNRPIQLQRQPCLSHEPPTRAGQAERANGAPLADHAAADGGGKAGQAGCEGHEQRRPATAPTHPCRRVAFIWRWPAGLRGGTLPEERKALHDQRRFPGQPEPMA